MKPALIDTDIVSYFLKGNEKVFIKFQEYLKHFDSINISIITYFFCSTATTKDSIKKSAQIYSKQRIKGEAIDDIDILIAGIAFSNNLVLVTNNIRHFGKIGELQIENWNE